MPSDAPLKKGCSAPPSARAAARRRAQPRLAPAQHRRRQPVGVDLDQPADRLGAAGHQVELARAASRARLRESASVEAIRPSARPSASRRRRASSIPRRRVAPGPGRVAVEEVQAQPRGAARPRRAPAGRVVARRRPAPGAPRNSAAATPSWAARAAMHAPMRSSSSRAGTTTQARSAGSGGGGRSRGHVEAVEQVARPHLGARVGQPRRARADQGVDRVAPLRVVAHGAAPVHRQQRPAGGGGGARAAARRRPAGRDPSSRGPRSRRSGRSGRGASAPGSRAAPPSRCGRRPTRAPRPLHGGRRAVDGEHRAAAPPARRSVSVPMEQPTSSADANGRSPSAAIVASYLPRS